MTRLGFAAPFTLFLPAALAMMVGGAWTWFLPVFTFIVLPLAEQPFSGSTRNATEGEEEARLADPWFDVIVWAVVPAQYALLGLFLWRMTEGGFAPWETAGAIATMGISCGVYGINVAHELGHRNTVHEQRMSLALLLTSLYMHFFVEHNRGHHRRVSTPEDPASARYREPVYAFWWRSVTGGIRSAWELEANRLQRDDVSPWTLDNAIVRYGLIQAAFVSGIGILAGPLTLAAFLVAATIGFLLLETVNYVEHYGLARQKTHRGVYERVRPVHSWNTERPLGRLFLFELTRHSDHHANASRKYQVLRHFDQAPQLPAGYPAMIMLSLVPPLFFRVMDRVLDRYSAEQPEAVAAT